MIFERFKEAARRAKEERERKKAEQQETERQRQREAEALRRAEFERQRKISNIRVITGDVKYRYAIMDTVRSWTVYVPEGNAPYDPTEGVGRAIRYLQEQAIRHGADAVIHAQFEILRYTTQRGKYHNVPCYEVYAFGTAIKIVGPPQDWVNEETSG